MVIRDKVIGKHLVSFIPAFPLAVIYLSSVRPFNTVGPLTIQDQLFKTKFSRSLITLGPLRIQTLCFCMVFDLVVVFSMQNNSEK